MPEITLKLGETIVHKYTFDKDVFSVGRAKDSDIVIETLSISRNQLRIRREGEHYILTDLHSSNGTFVNGSRVSKTEIMDGDVITIGKHKLYFALKPKNDENAINDALSADRTILVDNDPIGVLTVLCGKQKDQEFILDRYETTIGKAPDCEVRVQDWFVGKKHAIINREGGAFSVKDLGKLARVSVNDQAVSDVCRLKDGDTIKVGPVLMLFQIRSATSMMESAGRQPVEIGYDEPAPFDSIEEAPGADSDEESVLGEAPGEEFVLDEEESESAQEEIAEIEELHPLEMNDEEPSSPAEGPPPLSEDDRETPLGEPVAIAESLAAEAELARDDEPLKDLEVELAELVPEKELAVATPDKPDEGPVGPPIEEPPGPEQVDEGAPESVTPAFDESTAKEVALWERALQNSSLPIRREAARRLKKLTGADYDI